MLSFMVYLRRRSTCNSPTAMLTLNFLQMSASYTNHYMALNKPLEISLITLHLSFFTLGLWLPSQTLHCWFIFLIILPFSCCFMLMISSSMGIILLRFVISSLLLVMLLSSRILVLFFSSLASKYYLPGLGLPCANLSMALMSFIISTWRMLNPLSHLAIHRLVSLLMRVPLCLTHLSIGVWLGHSNTWHSLA